MMNRGFTLIEVLVSLALLTTALVPAFILAGRAVNLSTQIKNTLIGTNLAQEGVEVVRATRDANWLASSPPSAAFDTGLAACAGGCRVQWDTNATSGVLPAGNVPLKFDPATGLYQYTTGSNTIFSRTITITPVSAAELKVLSAVAWNERTGPKKISVEYHLFNWLP